MTIHLPEHNPREIRQLSLARSHKTSEGMNDQLHLLWVMKPSHDPADIGLIPNALGSKQRLKANYHQSMKLEKKTMQKRLTSPVLSLSIPSCSKRYSTIWLKVTKKTKILNLSMAIITREKQRRVTQVSSLLSFCSTLDKKLHDTANSCNTSDMKWRLSLWVEDKSIRSMCLNKLADHLRMTMKASDMERCSPLWVENIYRE